MQFRTKLIGFASLLALGAVLSAAITLWLSREIDRGLNSVTIAEEQLAIYLNLETATADLLRYYVTAPVLGGDEGAGPLEAAEAAVRADVADLRRLVVREVPFRGEQELEELDRLDEIASVLSELRALYANMRFEPGSEFGPLFRTIVTLIDESLAPLIDEAITDEAGEVAEARAEMATFMERAVALGTLAAALTLLATAIGLWLLLHSVSGPFRALAEGASRLADGDLAHRITVTSRGELGRLSTDFNAMAEELEIAHRELLAEEERLQRRVAERTAELERANAKLAEQDATRRRFLADVSHELRTPLTVMRGEAEVALRGHGDADGAPAKALSGIVEQVEHMGRLVDDLLFVARREAGEARLALRPTPLAPVLERAVKAAGVIAERASISIVLRNDAGARTLQADQGRLHQLLMVLLDNALRYSQRGGTVRIDAMRGTGGVAVRVADKGMGIPAEDVPDVFERFVRGSNALPGGTGLGLPVAKAIAEAHGGTIGIESEEGRGTTVTLTLPASSETPRLRSVA